MGVVEAVLPEDWAAADFPWARRLEMAGGIDAELIGALELPVLHSGAERHEWRDSEIGFVNSGVDCYMIAVVQMLGTACAVREALASSTDLADSTAIRALRADFGSGVVRGSRGGHVCHTARSHAAFGFDAGQQDAHEAITFMLDKWSGAQGVAPACPRMGFFAPHTTDVYKLFGILRERVMGCVFCKTMRTKVEEDLYLSVLPAAARGGWTGVRQQLDNFGSPERLDEGTVCGNEECGLEGTSCGRHNLRRVGAYLLV